MSAMQWTTWSRDGWVPIQEPGQLPCTAAATVGHDGSPATATTPLLLTEDEEETFSRRLKDLREAMGLDRAEAALLCDLDPRTLTRAEEDPVYEPRRETLDKLSWVFGEHAWEHANFHVVGLLQQQQETQEAALQRVCGKIVKALAAPYRRKATGATAVLTRAALGDPAAFLLLSACLTHRPRQSPSGPTLDALSREEERECGFPERQFGEVVQRTGGVFTRFTQAATAYADAVLTDVDPQRAYSLGVAVWDALDELREDDLTDLSADLMLHDVQQEILLHLTGWTVVQNLGSSSSLTPGQEAYCSAFGSTRPKVSGDLWEALGVWENDLAWQQAVQNWRSTRQDRGERETDPSTPTLDEGLLWAETVPEDFVSEVLGVDLDAVRSRVQVLLARSREEILLALRKAARWAVLEAGDQPTANPLLRFYRKVVVTCRGKGKIKGLGLDPRTVCRMVDLQDIFSEALQARQREQSLWHAVHGWIEQPCRGPAETGEAESLACALLSLLPDPPIAAKARLEQEEARVIVQQLAPQFVPDGATDLERARRFTLGALKAWIQQHKRPLPIRVVEEHRRRALFQGTLAALSGRGEENTGGKMARAVLSSLPRVISTPGLTLATAQIQERLQKGLPYFFPRKTATQAFAEAKRIVLNATQQCKASA